MGGLVPGRELGLLELDPVPDSREDCLGGPGPRTTGPPCRARGSVEEEPSPVLGREPSLGVMALGLVKLRYWWALLDTGCPPDTSPAAAYRPQAAAPGSELLALSVYEGGRQSLPEENQDSRQDSQLENCRDARLRLLASASPALDEAGGSRDTDTLGLTWGWSVPGDWYQ